VNDATGKLSVLKWTGIVFRILAVCWTTLAALDIWLSTDLFLSARVLLGENAVNNPTLWDEVESKEALIARLEIPNLIIGLVVMAVWLAWLYGSVRWLRLAQRTGLEYSPTMIVIWHFIPVMQLWKPMHAYIELASASSDDPDWKALPPPHIAVLTALLLTISGLANVGYMRLLHRADEISDVVNLIGFRIVIDVLTIAALGAMILFTLKVYRNLLNLGEARREPTSQAKPDSQTTSV
jgi:hypothetical protein